MKNEQDLRNHGKSPISETTDLYNITPRVSQDLNAIIDQFNEINGLSSESETDQTFDEYEMKTRMSKVYKQTFLSYLDGEKMQSVMKEVNDEFIKNLSLNFRY